MDFGHAGVADGSTMVPLVAAGARDFVYESIGEILVSFGWIAGNNGWGDAGTCKGGSGAGILKVLAAQSQFLGIWPLAFS